MKYFWKRKISWKKVIPQLVGAAGAIVFWRCFLESIGGTPASVTNHISYHGAYTATIIKTNYNMGENIVYALTLTEIGVARKPGRAWLFPLETDTPNGTPISLLWRDMHYVDIYIATAHMHGTLIIKQQFEGDTINTKPLIVVIHYHQ